MAAAAAPVRSVLSASPHLDLLRSTVTSSTNTNVDHHDHSIPLLLRQHKHNDTITATDRSKLLSSYFALEPSPALLKAADDEQRAANTVSNLAHRINVTRQLALDETPSEKLALDRAAEKLSNRRLALSTSSGGPALRRVQHLSAQQRDILTSLYPRHPTLHLDAHALLNQRRRIALLKDALKDQNVALTKLSDAANLLLLVADHVQVLASYYAQPPFSSTSCSPSSSTCPPPNLSHFPNSPSSTFLSRRFTTSFSASLPSSRSSASSSSSSSAPCSRESSLDCGRRDDNDAVRVGCLGRCDEFRGPAPFYVSTVPSSYRFRYLRKCWGYAADALVAAVDASSFLYRHVERLGQRELIPGLEAQCKRCVWLVEFPGGVTVFFKADFLLKMESDARSMRTDVIAWHCKVQQFASKIRKELTSMIKKESILDDRLFEARKRLLETECNSK